MMNLFMRKCNEIRTRTGSKVKLTGYEFLVLLLSVISAHNGNVNVPDKRDDVGKQHTVLQGSGDTGGRKKNINFCYRSIQPN